MNLNAIGKIASGLMAQYVGGGNNAPPAGNDVITPGQNQSSFQSILQLLDTNGDSSLDANELRTGMEGFISNFILTRDLNGDQALNVEETGISAEAVQHLDANGNQLMEGEEILAEAGRIFEGLIALLDTNKDQSLSMQELAIVELLFGSIDPAAETDSIFERSGTGEGETLTLNMDSIPERMRQAGFEGSDNALYYALAHVYNMGPDREMPTEGDESLMALNKQRDEIHKWFEAEMVKVENVLKTNPRATLTAITNDARDRCGFRLGPAIVERLQAFGDRVKLGDIVPDSEY
jgi:Ca2+-binding EF-hand superfamily protein